MDKRTTLRARTCVSPSAATYTRNTDIHNFILTECRMKLTRGSLDKNGVREERRYPVVLETWWSRVTGQVLAPAYGRARVGSRQCLKIDVQYIQYCTASKHTTVPTCGVML